MATVLLDLLRDRQLVLYPDAELRAHALATVGVESPRGLRIGKDGGGRKIDGVVALALAAVAAAETFAADAAAAARLAAALDPREIARELRQIRRAMPWMDFRILADPSVPLPLDDLVVGDGLNDSDEDYIPFHPWQWPRYRR